MIMNVRNDTEIINAAIIIIITQKRKQKNKMMVNHHQNKINEKTKIKMILRKPQHRLYIH